MHVKLVVVLAFLLCALELSLQADTCAECYTASSGLINQCRNIIPNSNFSLCSELDQIVSELEGVFRSIGLSIPPEFFQSGGFLRVLAFVETRDESNWPRSCCEDGGIWNVQISDLNECQRTTDIRNIVPPFWFINAREDLDCPINSAFGAVLLMLCNIIHTNNYRSVATAAADLPTERDSFPSFYARYYCHPNCDKSEATERFSAGMQEYLSTPCGSVVESCSEAFDIIVLLDSSGSIGDAQFADACTAVANLSSRYTIGSDYTRFGVILYSDIVHNTRDEDVIALDEYTDSANLTAAILSLPYYRGRALTGSAITYATEHGFNTAFGARERGAVPQILIVATDGRSFDDVTGPSQAAARAGIDLFSIGIGDGPDQNQLLEIVRGVSSRVFNTEDYWRLIGLSPLLAAETCKAQVSVPPGMQAGYSLVAGTVKYFQITIPENCSQSLMLSFARVNSSGSVIVYASFTIPNPNKRLHDFKWTITAEPVNATIPPEQCNRQQEQAPSPCSPPCQNGGSCVSPHQCVCTLGWTGADCRQAICNFPCYNGGHCSAPDRCTCTTGWEGQDCSLAVCSPVCANGGTCVSPQQCSCVVGWTGSNCDTAICNPSCENGGTCVAPNNCTCPSGWTGNTCSQVVCSPPCQNGGSCVSPHHCVCTHGWTGTGCNRQVCASGAQPSCPPAGLRHGPPTCGVCRQISEHSYCEDLVQVVANLSGLEPFTSLGIDSAFFEPQGFLHVLAFVETRDGLLLSDCDKGGIWNVNYIQLFNCLSQSSLLSYPYHTEYKFTVSLVDSFTYEDFNCPASSAFAALLLLICNSSPNDPVAAAANLPTERDSFPSFYARYYCHPNCNESGAEMKFQEGMQAFEGCTRKKRHLTSPYTSTGSELSWNADTVETAEDNVNSDDKVERTSRALAKDASALYTQDDL